MPPCVPGRQDRLIKVAGLAGLAGLHGCIMCAGRAHPLFERGSFCRHTGATPPPWIFSEESTTLHRLGGVSVGPQQRKSGSGCRTADGFVRREEAFCRAACVGRTVCGLGFSILDLRDARQAILPGSAALSLPEADYYSPLSERKMALHSQSDSQPRLSRHIRAEGNHSSRLTAQFWCKEHTMECGPRWI